MKYQNGWVAKAVKRMTNKYLFSVLVGMAIWLPVLAQAQMSERVALVVGNASYKRIPLSNPANDANGMAQLLKRAGF